MDRFMGLRPLGTAAASPINGLSTQRSVPWTLKSEEGKTVVLTFFDSSCRDLCPVLGSEIQLAQARLGSRAAMTEFVIVNTDPSSTAISARPPALSITGLSALSDVVFLNGPLPRLSDVWNAYGIQVVVTNAGSVVHNDAMYFIDPQGRLRSLAIPFADQAPDGAYSLSQADVSRFATGIATAASTISKSAS